MEQNSLRTATPIRKKVKKITLTAGIILGVICFLLGLLFGGAFSSGKNADELEKQVAELELRVEEQTAKTEKLEETYKVKINDLKREKAELKEELKKSDNASPENTKEDGTPASEIEDTNTGKSSGGVLKKIIIALLVLAVIGGILFAASIFLKKNNHEDDEEYDDEYDDDEYDDYDDDEYDDDEYDDDEYEDDEEDED